MNADLSGLQISGEQWMDCDNVPYDTPEDEVKIYGLEVKQNFKKKCQFYACLLFCIFYYFSRSLIFSN